MSSECLSFGKDTITTRTYELNSQLSFALNLLSLWLFDLDLRPWCLASLFFLSGYLEFLYCLTLRLNTLIDSSLLFISSMFHIILLVLALP